MTPVRFESPPLLRGVLLLCLCLLVCAPASRAADAAPPSFHRVAADDVPSRNAVSALLQDRRGLVWLATRGGLLVHDGYASRAVPADPADPAALAGLSATTLIEDARGRLWVAGTGARPWLDRYEPVSGAVVHFPATLFATGRPGAETVALLADEDGAVWIGTNAGLHRWDPLTDTLAQRVDGTVDRAPLDAVTAIARSADGALWLGTPKGLRRWARDTNRIDEWRRVEGDAASLPDDRVTALRVARDGRVWVGTQTGVAVLDPRAGTFARPAPAPVGAPPDEDAAGDRAGRGAKARDTVVSAPPAFDPATLRHPVRALLESRDGGMLVAMAGGGLARIDATTVVVARHAPADPRSLPSDDVAALLEDRSGLLWIGTPSGLAQRNPSTQRFAVPRGDGLASAQVADVATDAAGAVWVATSVGLDRYNPAAGAFRRYAPSRNEPALNSMRTVHVDRRDGVWVGATDGHLYVFLPQTEAFAAVARAGVSGRRFSNGPIHAIGESGDGRLWVAAGEGLFALDAGTRAVLETVAAQDLPEGALPVHATAGDTDGAQWFATGRGLLRHEPDKGITATLVHDAADPATLADDVVEALHNGADGSLWVGTRRGLQRLSPADRRAGRNRFQSWPRDAGATDAAVLGIAAGADAGHLWLATADGVSRFDVAGGAYRDFTVHDGLPATAADGGAAATPDGRLWFGTANGLAGIDPAAVHFNDVAPDAHLSSIERHDGAASPASVLVDPAAPLEFAHDRAALTVRFAATDYQQPGKNRFRWRLVGPTTGPWIETSQPSLSLAMLPPARWRLEVLAANNDGVWGQRPATLAIYVAPPWWRSGWALLAWALALALAAWLAWRLVRDRLRKERAVVAQLRDALALADAERDVARHHAGLDATALLPSRAAFLDAATAVLRAAPAPAPRALVRADVDGFDDVATFGPAVLERLGDSVARGLEDALGAGDVAATVGPGRFAVLVAADTDDALAAAVARVRAALDEPLPLGDALPPLAVRIGVARRAAPDATALELMAVAEAGLREVAAAPRAAAPTRQDLDARLRRALESNACALQWQPELVLVRRRLSAARAHLHAKVPRGLPSACEDLAALADASALAGELARRQLRDAARQIAAWRRDGFDDAPVVVEVPVRTLRAPQFRRDVERVLREVGVVPANLVLALAAPRVAECVDDVREPVAALRATGVQVRLEGFGTAAAPLDLLRRMPVDAVAVDRRIVAALPRGDAPRRTIAGIARVAHALGVHVTGDGAATEVLAEWLRSLGVDAARGDLFGGPQSADELARRWLQRAAAPAA